MKKLTDVILKNSKPKDKPYKIIDGDVFYIQVSCSSTKRWYRRYRFDGKETLLAFGAYLQVTLVQARAKNDEITTLLSNGINPSEQRPQEKVICAKRVRNYSEFQVKKYIAGLRDMVRLLSKNPGIGRPS